jgi:branched-chain amino acid transport system ATP-binding protein
VYSSLERLGREGTTVVLVEQDLARAIRFSDRLLCMLEGRVVLEGLADSLTREQVTAAYFGLGTARGGVMT